ncbi:IS1096 element passenger TnpR family protein [Kitasatospora sp. NBC_00085]|uniref:IS1096 element passenger TnpR family protein n=1 Tax=Kitasatospora sp. NBC_00085 TaxID=2903566 RepID=UPI003864C3E3
MRLDRLHQVIRITVERRMTADAGHHYPVCVDGAGACPSEDCGGPGGYEGLKQTLHDSANPEHEDLLRRLGLKTAADFDPARFDLRDQPATAHPRLTSTVRSETPVDANTDANRRTQRRPQPHFHGRQNRSKEGIPAPRLGLKSGRPPVRPRPWPQAPEKAKRPRRDHSPGPFSCLVRQPVRQRPRPGGR